MKTIGSDSFFDCVISNGMTLLQIDLHMPKNIKFSFDDSFIDITDPLSFFSLPPRKGGREQKE